MSQNSFLTAKKVRISRKFHKDLYVQGLSLRPLLFLSFLCG